MSSSLIEYIRTLHTVHLNSLTEEPAISPQIPENMIKVPLHPHQRAVLSKMEETEQGLVNGLSIKNHTLFSNCGILGDSVGVGKSLMVLAHIARLNMMPKIMKQKSIHSSMLSNMFSITDINYSEVLEAGSLIIVPHTLFRQWTSYIKQQTNLKAFCVAKINEVESNDFLKTAIEADVVLVSNTLCKYFIPRCRTLDIKWKRVFIDEADTIHLPGMYFRDIVQTRFLWFITASWVNLMYLNANLYFDRNAIQTHVFSQNTDYNYLQPHFKSRLGASTSFYVVETLRVRSYSFLRELLSSSHPLRMNTVIKCSDALIKKSISLPQLIRQIIWCKSPLTHQILKDAVSTNIQQMLHAGDVKGALEELNVKGKDTKSLIEAVTENLTKDLERTKKTYEYKSSLDYSTPQAKEIALKSLQDKMNSIQNSIQSISDRIENFSSEVCPICYDEPNDHLITPCCSRVFCAACLLLSMARNPSCPLCREKIHPSGCTKIIPESSKNEIVDDSGVSEPILPKKQEALLQIMKDNPKGRFLLFSRYDNPFENIETAVNNLGIQVKQVKGNKNAVSATLKAFDTGATQCLLLNSQYAGAGLNITAATHVILLHAMTHEEEKQVLGRAYRIGRSGALTFIKLLHKGEEAYAEGSTTVETV
jgi:SNF2-related domain/Helicase conserved C-terminal domain/Zinc finger, C3HC4 type (RING finger)